LPHAAVTRDALFVQDGFDLGVVIYTIGFQEGRQDEERRGKQGDGEELFFRKGAYPKIHSAIFKKEIETTDFSTIGTQMTQICTDLHGFFALEKSAFVCSISVIRVPIVPTREVK
jgi:hypothetical protein